jgi:hypothetical protein
MTIIARLNTLSDAYAGMEALRMKAIPPDLSRLGEHLVISVDDDFAENAKSVLQLDGRFADRICNDTNNVWVSYDDHNA